MRIDELKPAPGSKHRRKIVGRGVGSGHGAQSTRGMKGQRSRSGFGGMTGFEGGQVPLLRRIPKRGFRTTQFKTPHSVVNVGDLELFEANTVINYAVLREKRIVKGPARLKVLGTGDIKLSLTVQAHAFSKSAQEKIEKAGGRIELLK